MTGVGDIIRTPASGERIYLTDPDATAPASPRATFLLWLLLGIAALVAIFLP